MEIIYTNLPDNIVSFETIRKTSKVLIKNLKCKEEMMSIFSYNLRYLRKQKNETLENVAKCIGKTKQAINNYESGLREPSINDLILLANHFGITIDKLLTINVKSFDETYYADLKQ